MRTARQAGGTHHRPPWRVQALRLTLLAQTALTAWLWLFVWRGLQSFAWIGGGVETDLLERSLSYLLVLAPTVPVNLLAVLWLARGGHRARLYLVGAGVLVAVQQILLLTPIDPGGSIAAGAIFALTVGPVAFTALALALTRAAKDWLREDRPQAARRVIGVESLVWGLTAVLALGIASSVDRWVAASAETGPPTGEYDESDVWERMEQAVAAADLDAFPGLRGRTVQVDPCGYRTEAGLRTYRYLIVYELEPFIDTADEAAYAAAVREAWSTGDHRLVHDGTTLEGDPVIIAERHDELTLHLTLGADAAIEVRSACLERVDDRPRCLAPQGGLTSGHDTIEGIICPEWD